MTLNKISKAFFINLDRRTDRLEHINKNLPFSAERFTAVDAKNLELNNEIKKIFGKNLQKFTKAEISCSLSHYKLWKNLTLDKDADNYLILEDDAVFKEGFTNFWNQVFSKHIPENYNLIYLGGCQPWNKPHYHKVLEKYNDYFFNIKRNDFFTKNDHFWHMNASSYVLSKTAASLLCQWVEQNGIDDALDNFMQRFFNKNKLFASPKSIYHLNPLMSYQLHEENDNIEIDKNSDIRYCQEKFNDDQKISVIIPTIWMANHYMMKSLLDLDKVDCIEEVIVINNDKTKTPHWINAFEKVKLVDPGKRMYFNESVNLGIDLCKNDICCIYNDDITSDTRVFNYVKNNFSEKYGCIFISPKYINQQTRSTGNLKKVNDIIKDGLHHGSGMMMFVRKNSFIKIPENLIHHFGDTFIFKINQKQDRQNYIIEGFPIQTPGSASEDDVVKKVISQDWAIHKQVFDDLDQFIPGNEICFPLLKGISNKEIPKKIFQTWENDKLEGVFKYLTDRVKSYNHSYSYEFFDGEKRRNFIKDNFSQDVLECYDLIIPGAFKADLWRYCVLYKYGGIYCDIDMLCFSCFDKVIIGDEIDFFAPIDINPRENICSHAVSNAFIGSSPGHPIIKICIDLIVQNIISERWLNESMIDLDFSGPGLLGRAINLFLGRSEKSKLKGCEGIIEKGLHKIKLIYFKQGLEYMTDLGGDIIFQNKNGNQSIKRLIIQQEKDSNVRPWIEYMIGGKLPYIKKDNTNDISLINPTAITYSGKQYTLYRGEKYLNGKPPPLGFYKSDFSYWLEVDGAKKQCTFNFDSYTYKTIRRIDIDLGSNKSIVEDLRLIESSARETNEGLVCLATCCLLPYTRIFQGAKNEDGSWNKSRGLGLEFTFRAAYCQVNLSTAEIKFIDQIDESSQTQNEKNWSCFIYDDEYYVIYSMFPLVYTKANSLADISFSDQDLSQELIYSSSTNPIKIGENQYVMLCHKRNKDKEFCYNYQLVTFEIKNGSICNIQRSSVNIDEGCYCSSIMKEGLKIKVFAGVRDLDNKCFNIDIPKIHINQFPNLQTISSNQIPKKIHLSWKNKNVLDSNYELIRKGAKNLELLNPGWDIQVYDDEDIDRLLRDSIGRDNWNLIKDRKITEKTDLWRLLKTYKEGGLYIDIDRYIDTPISEIVNHKTSCVLPTFQDVDFSQDFILTCAKNPIIGRAIANNLNYRKQGKPLFFLAVYSYMQSVCEILGTKIVDRGNNPEYFNDIRKQIEACEYLETFREIGPEHHTLFRNIDKQFDSQTFEKDKADFYNGENVVHWNAQTQAFHDSQKTEKQKLIFTHKNLFEQDFICELFDGFDVVINEDMNVVERDSVIVYSDMYAKNINAYPEKFRENLNQLRAKQKQYFEKLKNKNCILVHLSDEHCHAEIDHYKNFKHVFRQYYRKDAVSDNVTFIPLGYKKGFKT